MPLAAKQRQPQVGGKTPLSCIHLPVATGKAWSISTFGITTRPSDVCSGETPTSVIPKISDPDHLDTFLGFRIN